MKHKKDKISSISQHLDSLKPIEEVSDEVSTQQAIQLLRNDIQNLRKKGYSLKQICEILTEQGISILPSTLSTYLQKAKKKKKSTKKTSPKPHKSPKKTPEKKKVISSTENISKSKTTSSKRLGGFEIEEDREEL